jgi:hypothetical protein
VSKNSCLSNLFLRYGINSAKARSAPLVCCYCSVGYLSDWVDCLPSPCSSSVLPTLVCFLVFYKLMRKHLALLTDVVSGFKSFSEAPCLAQKCGTHSSDSLVTAL